MNRKTPLFALVLVLGACGAEPESTDGVTTAPPQFGPADSIEGGDVADRDCQVVLRSVERLEDEIGLPEPDCSSGRCWQVFEGTFDVDAELAEEGDAGVVYRSREGDYYVETAEPIPGAVDGYQRYEFRLDQDTIVDGVPSMTAARAHLEIIPFVESGRTRFFDHNVVDGDEENYEINARSGWSYEQRSDVCPARTNATLSFYDDFSHTLDGEIVPGGPLTIEYDLSRLPQCDGTWHNGRLAWQVGVTMKFLPDDGTLVRRQLMVAENSEAVPVPATVYVPAGAEAVEMWFHTSGAGCETHYDSNMDQNYRFEVER